MKGRTGFREAGWLLRATPAKHHKCAVTRTLVSQFGKPESTGRVLAGLHLPRVPEEKLCLIVSWFQRVASNRCRPGLIDTSPRCLLVFCSIVLRSYKVTSHWIRVHSNAIESFELENTCKDPLSNKLHVQYLRMS